MRIQWAYIRKRKRWLIMGLIMAASTGIVLLAGAGFLVERAAAGRVYDSLETIPQRKVGLVLGCARTQANGNSNLYFMFRIDAAVELHNAGKIQYVLVSGDNHVATYDEASDMKEALIQRGVPKDRIVRDYAGFRTLDSVVRAKEVFQEERIIVISQEFHNKRAIFIARHRGINAIGYNAQNVSSIGGLKTRLREQLAKVKAVLDVYVFRTPPKFLGDKIAIGKGNTSEFTDVRMIHGMAN